MRVQSHGRLQGAAEWQVYEFNRVGICNSVAEWLRVARQRGMGICKGQPCGRYASKQELVNTTIAFAKPLVTAAAAQSEARLPMAYVSSQRTCAGSAAVVVQTPKAHRDSLGCE